MKIFEGNMLIRLLPEKFMNIPAITNNSLFHMFCKPPHLLVIVISIEDPDNS